MIGELPNPYQLIFAEQVDSTNTLALDTIRQQQLGAADHVVLALRQTAGRGRMTRTWDSPMGNLFTSLIINPAEDDVAHPGLYAQVTALAAAEAIEAICHPGPRLKLKWPNDILIDGKKVSGLLLERDQASGLLVIGLGVNLKTHPKGLPYPATDILSSTGQNIEIFDFLSRFITLFHGLRLRLRAGQASGMIKEWGLLLAHEAGDNITVRLPSREIKGHYAGIDPGGRLILKLADGTNEYFYSGDVFFG